jgi:choline dehydrogenase-like flavoprotein
MNWGYKTTTQPGLDGRELDYSRGKGLGGSSAINFSVFDIGPRDDFEEIARLAGDDSWNWQHAQARFKRLETFHGEVPAPYEKYVRANNEDHGSAGKLHIGFTKVWEKTMGDLMQALEESASKINPDINCGDPIGWGPCPSSAYNGLRSTSADLVLNGPENLTIVTEQIVHRIVFDGNRAVGIETKNNSYYATKEVILSCGSLDTPKLLMLSGVGPADELAKLNIPILKDLGHVGKGLRDHNHLDMLWKRAEHTSEKWKYYRNPEAIAAAIAQWDKDQTGPLAHYNANFPIAFLKNERIYASAEFEALPEDVKNHLRAPTVPLFEVIIGAVDARDMMDPTQSEASLPVHVFMLNGQSRGEITLQSHDAADPAIFNPNAFSHPFDRRVAIEATRETMRLISSPAFSKDTIGVVKLPASDSDEDILAYWREQAISTWHMTGTAKMGKAGEEDACVDNDLRVFGTTSLRIADMSICPVLPNNHTQTSAYYIGATAGDKLAAEYKLD